MSSEDSATGEIAELNERFYEAEPADYFHIRLLSLLVLGARPEAVMDVLKSEVTYDGIVAQVSDDTEIEPSSLRQYVAMESQVLLHHAAEAVLRLFLGHRDDVACPWLEIAADRDFARFKSRVDEEIIKPRRTGDLEGEVMWVFLGHRQPPPEADAEEWQSPAMNLTKFLRVLADRWLSEATVYNAIKHGLAIVPGEAVIQFAPEGGEMIRLGDGATVELLTSTPWKRGSREWSLTTRWLDVGGSLALVQVAQQMIDSLWYVARFRYANGEGGGRLFFPTDLSPTDLRGARGPIQTFSRRILSERRHPPGRGSSAGQAPRQ